MRALSGQIGRLTIVKNTSLFKFEGKKKNLRAYSKGWRKLQNISF